MKVFEFILGPFPTILSRKASLAKRICYVKDKSFPECVANPSEDVSGAAGLIQTTLTANPTSMMIPPLR
jgi:hypothetical protein